MEKLIGDGIVTDSELQEKIEKAKAKSPITRITKDEDGIGQLITFLIQHDENMSQMINMLMMKVMELENRVKELEK